MRYLFLGPPPGLQLRSHFEGLLKNLMALVRPYMALIAPL